MITAVFWAFAALALGGALAVLLTRNVLYAAFFLLLTLLGVAGLFVLAGADFLAVAQIMIYVGGVLVLIIFGVMLITRPVPGVVSVPATPNRLLTGHRNPWIAGSLAGALFVAFMLVIVRANFALLNRPVKPWPTTIDTIGKQLMTEYIVPFEVISILLLAALVGAAYLAMPKK